MVRDALPLAFLLALAVDNSPPDAASAPSEKAPGTVLDELSSIVPDGTLTVETPGKQIAQYFPNFPNYFTNFSNCYSGYWKNC